MERITLRMRLNKLKNNDKFKDQIKVISDMIADKKKDINKIDKALYNLESQVSMDKINTSVDKMKQSLRNKNIGENIMKLDNIINEVQAEIVGKKIPGKKIFDNQGNMTGDEFKGSQNEKVLAAIFRAIYRQGLMDQFSPDSGDIDIKPGKVIANGGETEYILSPDIGGKKYKYVVKTDKIVEV